MTVRRRLAWLAVCAALLAAAASGWLALRQRPPIEGLLLVNGRIEGDRVTIAPKMPGRVAELAAREGDTVRAGQVLVRLDDAAVRARLDQAVAATQTLQAQVAAQESALGVLRGESAVHVDAARAGIDAAEAELRRAEAARAQQAREHERTQDLSAQGFVGPQALERAALALRQASEQHNAALAALAQSRQALRDAQLGPQRVNARAAEIAVSRARLQEALAAVDEARTALDDLTIRAPAAGTVTGRFVDAGEVVAGGAPLLELTDLSRLYLKGYVPEVHIGRVRRGMPARIHVDAYPGQGIPATLRYVAARAEFTPKEVQTLDERVKLVYEVRLYADGDPVGRLNPGQPADAVMRWRDDAAWQPPWH